VEIPSRVNPCLKKNPGAVATGLTIAGGFYWMACGGVAVLKVQVALLPTVVSA
jgi:hypothetical protein